MPVIALLSQSQKGNRYTDCTIIYTPTSADDGALSYSITPKILGSEKKTLKPDGRAALPQRLEKSYSRVMSLDHSVPKMPIYCGILALTFSHSNLACFVSAQQVPSGLCLRPRAFSPFPICCLVYCGRIACLHLVRPRLTKYAHQT